MTRHDWRLVIVLVMISVFLLGLRLLPASGGRLRARVELEGKSVRVINLKEANGTIVDISMPRGKARLEAKQGAIRLLPLPLSICPRKVCSHTGWIKRPGESIICVPNRLVIRLAGEGGKPVDAVTK